MPQQINQTTIPEVGHGVVVWVTKHRKILIGGDSRASIRFERQLPSGDNPYGYLNLAAPQVK
jgi:hypothetical protein